MILLMNIVNAQIDFWQTLEDRGNKSVLNHIFLSYTNLNDDFVSGGNTYQGYIWYSVYVKQFNENNPNYRIDFCNITITQYTDLGIRVLLSRIYTKRDIDAKGLQQFFNMRSGDYLIADELCVFNPLANQSDLTIPAEMQLVVPTWECKSCQEYNYASTSLTIDKTSVIGQNTASITNFIRKLVALNFEIILSLFWIFLILMIFLAVSFIFLGFFYLYRYIERMTK